MRLVPAGILLGWMAAAAPLGAQAVAGTLLDDRTGRAVHGAPVVLLDSTGAVAARARTAINGRFRLLAPRGGRYLIRAEVDGRPLLSDTIALPAPRDIEVALRPPPALARDSVAEADAPDLREMAAAPAAAERLAAEGFAERRAAGTGIQRTAAEMGDRDGGTPLDRIAALGGMAIARDGDGRRILREARGCTAALWIDGIPRPAHLLDGIAGDRMIAVEIYAAGQVPPRFRLPGDGTDACGVVALWLDDR
ncbi:MAG TPA: carboxypeptidase-like regulatory domain-containing protein [Longimicrobium sp.]|nr:carboxypeptidase-like regulatory domain-containing protein [Longimicrobium sp.]